MAPPNPMPSLEHAIEGVDKAGACVGIRAKNGMVLAAEIVNRDPLLDLEMQTGPIYKVDKNNACVVAGIAADGIKLVDAMTKISRRHKQTYGEFIRTERLVELICLKKRKYTMYEGKLPFGISVIYMGWDSCKGYQLYQSDPSGIYTPWCSNSIGRNALRAQCHLNQEICGNPEPNLLNAMVLAIQALELAMDNGAVNGDRVQMATLQHIDDKSDFQMLSSFLVDEVCRVHHNRQAVNTLNNL